MTKTQLIESIENHQQTEELIVDEEVQENTLDVPEEVIEENNVNTLKEVKNVTEINLDAQSNEPVKKNKKRLIEYNGKTQTLTAWAKELGIRHQTLYNRIVMKGMDPAEAFEKPIKKGGQVNVG